VEGKHRVTSFSDDLYDSILVLYGHIPQIRALVYHAKEQRKALSRVQNVDVAERRLRDLQVAYDRLKRENAELRSRGRD
jgi:hypothetical protein